VPEAGIWLGSDDVGEECFGRGVTVQDAILAAFLIVDDDFVNDLNN
jgi:hypothetical protein